MINRELVVYREFDDGTDEIGILILDNYGYWVHVGNFDYFLSWNNFNWPFTIIGVL